MDGQDTGTQGLTPEEQGFVDELNGSIESEDNQNDDQTDEDQDNENQDDDNQNDNEEDDVLDLLDPNNRSNKAFAQMRVQNKQQAELIAGIATMLGFDPKQMSSEELTEQLNNVITQQTAKNQQVPVELLERITNLERINESYRQDQIRGQARAGLNMLKEKYGATQEDLMEFIDELQESGRNPLAEAIDYEAEYLKKNMDKIIAAKVEAAVKEEAERNSKVDNHASKPNGANGNSGQEEPKKINSVAELTRFLNENA